MKQGDFMVGAGEVGRDVAFDQINPDDLARNRNRNIIPRFFSRHIKCADGTFLEREYLELLVPGDPKSSPCHLVDDRLIALYSTHYQAFKENRQLPENGTPVEAWVGNNESLVLMLKSLHLKTVEDVAEMSDAVIARIGMGGRELRKRAQAFLDAQKNTATADVIVAQASEIEELRARLAKLEKGEVEVEEETEEEDAIEVPKPKITMKKADKKGKLWLVMIDDLADGDPMSEKEAKKRVKELEAENAD